MEIVIILVGAIVAIIYAGFNLLREEEFGILSNSNLSVRREEYDLRLQIYYNNHQPRLYLKNNYCEMRLFTKGGTSCFYCKEKTDGINKGHYFDVKGDNSHVNTMWAIMDMEFNSRTTYSDAKNLYRILNRGTTSTNGSRYFYEPLFNKYPDYSENVAQNEYCRMELHDVSVNNELSSTIICSEIWGDSTRQFMISGNKFLLSKILSEFKNDKKKFLTYEYLYAKYSSKHSCIVKELGEKDETNYEPQKKLPESEIFEQNVQKEPEPIQYLHSDTNKEITEKQKNDNIEKYNERNLDL